MEGLLGADQMEKLKGQATSTGLANMVLGYLAAPKNQNLGLGRILGGALQSGMQGAQGVYSGALGDYETKQKLDEMKRQQEARNVFETESKNVLTTTPAQYQTIATSGGYEPQQPNADQMSPNFNLTKLPDVVTQVQTAPARQSLNQDALMKLALSGDPRAKVYVETLQAMKDLNPVAKPRPTQVTPNGQLIYSDTGELVTTRNFAAPKEAPSMTEEPNRVALALYNKPINQLTQSEIGKVNNYIEQSKIRVAGATVPSRQPSFTDATLLRKEITDNPIVKAFNTTDSAYKIIKSSLGGTPSPAGDLAGVTKFMKILDPESVVRESEVGLAMGATGLYDKMTSYYDRMISGQKLNPIQRKDFLDTATKFYDVARKSKSNVENQYIGLAIAGGLNPKLVVGSPTSETSLTDADKQALYWANKNPKDPRSAQIKLRLGKQ
jgi:hypothetical protein